MKNPIDTDLHGKTAVVTGAGGVLCSVFSKALAAAGAKVALLDLNLEAAEKVAAEINADGGEAKAFRVNVLDRAVLEACHEQVLAALGKCDILINGAGGNNPRATTDKEYYETGDLDTATKSFFDLKQEDVGFVFDLNFLGASMNAYTPLTKIPAYSGAKAAISNFTQWLAVHFVKEGIRVNAIAPGFLSTNQNRTLLWNPDGTPTARTGKILAATPMGRFGEPEELVGAVLFLLDEKAASFITGVVIPIDGGFSAYSGV